MSHPVKLLQLTDLHLSADQNAEMSGRNVQQQVDEVVDAALKDPLWPADVLVITGDIADTMDEDDFRRIYHRLGARLAGLDTKVCCIPGNHDHSALLKDILPEYGIQTAGCFICGNWQVLLLDSSIPGQKGGKLGPKQLNELDQLLPHKKTQHCLVMIHHPIIDIKCHWMDLMKVVNGDELLRRLAPLPGEKIVVWGHAHQEFDEIREGVRLLGTPAACPVQYKPLSKEYALDENQRPGYRWCILYDDGVIDSRVVRV